MTDDVHFGELQCSLVHPENNFSLGQDHSVQDFGAQDLGAQDRNAQIFNASARPAYHGQKAITEMIIQPWYLDEFGNPTREIKRHD